MNAYNILVVVILAAALITAIVCYFECKKKYGNLVEVLSLEDMKKAEEEIENFYSSKNLKPEQPFRDVLKAAKVKSVRFDPFIHEFGAVEETDDGEYIIKTKSPRNTQSSIFDSAHECAHIIIGDDVTSIARGIDKGKHEQYVDYMAAALILPQKVFCESLKRDEYFSMSINQKTQYVIGIAKEYNLSDTVVIRRIKELKKLGYI